MAELAKPVILISHGAWHQPLHYRLLIDRLRARGFTVLAPPLATAAYDDSIIGKDHWDDVRRLHEALLPQLDAGRTALVVAHSYGGIPTTEALRGHTLAERAARGIPGGVVGLIFVAAHASIQGGMSMYEAGGRQWNPPSLYDVEEFDLALKKAAAADAFYNGLDGPVKDEAFRNLCKQSRRPFESTLEYTVQEIQVPKTYLIATEDRAIHLNVQRLYAQIMGATVVERNCGHFAPFLKDEELDFLVDLIVKAAGH